MCLFSSHQREAALQDQQLLHLSAVCAAGGRGAEGRPTEPIGAVSLSTLGGSNQRGPNYCWFVWFFAQKRWQNDNGFLQCLKIANHHVYFLSAILLNSMQEKRALPTTNEKIGTQTDCCLSTVPRLSGLSRCYEPDPSCNSSAIQGSHTSNAGPRLPH